MKMSVQIRYISTVSLLAESVSEVLDAELDGEETIEDRHVDPLELVHVLPHLAVDEVAKVALLEHGEIGVST